MSGRLDRDAARDVLLKIFGFVDQGPLKRAAALDALEACICPDHDLDVERAYHDGRDETGVTLTRDEAARARRWHVAAPLGQTAADYALAEKLAAAS